MEKAYVILRKGFEYDDNIYNESEGGTPNLIVFSKEDAQLKVKELNIENEIILKTPTLDVVIFNFFKLRGNTIFTPELTSFYRLNANGVYRKRSMKQNHKDRFFINWHLFIYVHKDPFLYLRTLGFMAKRYFLHFVKPKVTGDLA